MLKIKILNGSTIAAIAVLLIISGCSGPLKKNHQEKLLLTSFYPVQITVLNLTKGVAGIKTSMLSQPGTGCLHNYQLTPVDMGKIENADCIVINGAGMESFLNEVIEKQKSLIIINASAKCKLLHNEMEQSSGEEHNDNSHHDHHGEVNPHVWLSLIQYIQQVKTITEGLCAWDTTHATYYRANMELYLNQLKQLKLELDSLMNNIYYRDIITFHSAFNYLASDYHLNVRAVIQQEPGQEPSAADIVELIRIIKTYKVQAVFVEPQYQSKTADLLHRETGVRVDTLDPVVTGEIVPDAYLKAMRKNGQILYKALKRDVP